MILFDASEQKLLILFGSTEQNPYLCKKQSNMNKELFRAIISENQEFIGSIPLVERPLHLEESGNYVFVGVRQAGKSYLLYQRVKELLGCGINLHDIVYVNFDDERLLGMTTDDFDLILQAYYSMHGGQPIFFFDEIQNVDGWANFARRLANQKHRVYVTGSNAKMLSRDIETVLGGRYLSVYVFTYSFEEYLKAIGISVSGGSQYGRKANELQRHFRTYFEWGGFPELVNFREKRVWLNSLYNRIFFNDLVVRHKVKNEDSLRMCIRRLAESVMQPCSLNRLSNLVKSTGMPCSPSTVMEYVRYLQESCLLISLDNYASKFVDKETVKKHYFIDNGLVHLFINNPDTALLENICAINLYKRYGKGVYYFNRNIEVDFYVPDEKLAIQASFRMSEEATLEREIKALVALHGLYETQRNLIVTYEDEGIMERDGIKIEIIPVWKWLLDM